MIKEYLKILDEMAKGYVEKDKLGNYNFGIFILFIFTMYILYNFIYMTSLNPITYGLGVMGLTIFAFIPLVSAKYINEEYDRLSFKEI